MYAHQIEDQSDGIPVTDKYRILNVLLNVSKSNSQWWNENSRLKWALNAMDRNRKLIELKYYAPISPLFFFDPVWLQWYHEIRFLSLFNVFHFSCSFEFIGNITHSPRFKLLWSRGHINRLLYGPFLAFFAEYFRLGRLHSRNNGLWKSPWIYLAISNI